MSRVLLAAKSGWGKSWNMQKWLEANLPEQDYAVILDYKDEYRGLVEGIEPSNSKTDLCSWFVAGPTEQQFSVEQWQQVIEQGERVVIPRYRVDGEDWREISGRILSACRRIYEDDPGASILAAIDEAHLTAPQRLGYPEPIKKAATTGRGEGLSTLWVTQRLSELCETIIAQCDEQILGGFSSDADLDKISVDYPSEAHDTRTSTAPSLPDELLVDGDRLPVRKFKDGDSTIGSEWIRSTDAGLLERIDTRDVTLHSKHYGSEGQTLKSPYS